jgi:hypothetical protein
VKPDVIGLERDLLRTTFWWNQMLLVWREILWERPSDETRCYCFGERSCKNDILVKPDVIGLERDLVRMTFWWNEMLLVWREILWERHSGETRCYWLGERSCKNDILVKPDGIGLERSCKKVILVKPDVIGSEKDLVRTTFLWNQMLLVLREIL